MWQNHVDLSTISRHEYYDGQRCYWLKPKHHMQTYFNLTFGFSRILIGVWWMGGGGGGGGGLQLQGDGSDSTGAGGIENRGGG